MNLSDIGFLAQQTQGSSWLTPFYYATEFAKFADSGNWNLTIAIVIVLAIVLVLPFFLGNVIANAVRMPAYSWKIGLILCSVFGSLVVIYLGWPPKLGVDLKGGWVMIWGLDQEQDDVDPTAPKRRASRSTDETDIRAAFIEALKRRINPDGLKEISIRKYGTNQIEIIVPETDDAEIEKIKQQILSQGFLEFLILAERSADENLFAQARDNSKKESTKRIRILKNDEGKTIGKWVEVGRDDKLKQGVYPLRIQGGWGQYLARDADGNIIESGTIPADEIAAAKFFDGRRVEVLMKVNEADQITGRDLRNTSKGIDENGFPSVNFAIKTSAADRMGGLTQSNRQRQLSIVLDGKLLSHATIQSQITDSGRITGRFSDAEVEFIVRVLKAGSLPAKAKAQPDYQEPSDPTLGAENIRDGAIAVAVSLILVFVFALAYYRTSGVIASIALILNILLTLAVMILFGATLTMPGLAGLVLTVGMAVDSNVLIFERIREELDRGASLRMAIRNGFDRAWATIIDSNLTTLLTAVILYVIGTDQLVGFAVTLTLGIITSMFTAVFVSRVMFEVLERMGAIKTLSFMHLMTGTNYDFVKWTSAAVAVSTIMIVVGIGAAIYRGGGLFDVDLRGGTSVQIALREPLGDAEMRKLLDGAFKDKRLEDGAKVDYSLKPVGQAIDGGKHASYRIDTIIPKIAEVQDLLADKLKDDKGESLLKYYQLSFEPVSDKQGSLQPKDESAFFVSAQDESKKPDEEKSEGSTPAAPGEKKDDETPKAEEPQAVEAPKTEIPTDDQPKAAGEKKPVETSTGTADETKTPLPERNSEFAEEKPETSDASGSLVTSKLHFGDNVGTDEGIDATALRTRIETAAKELDIELLDIGLKNPDWKGNSDTRYSDWTVSLGATPAQAERILSKVQSNLTSSPVWPASKEIGSQIAGDFVKIAIVAILGSMLGIIAYIWVRFQNVYWGFAAIVALIHDVLFMLAGIAVSSWLVGALGWLQVEEFKIDLTVIAAFLTLIGYSINDTIVTFDRMREIKGKLPTVNRRIVNDSINQTLSRTILTFATVFIVVVVLYLWGGRGIHAFAYAMLIGTVVGCYSSIYIAAPFLLYMIGAETQPVKKAA